MSPVNHTHINRILLSILLLLPIWSNAQLNIKGTILHNNSPIAGASLRLTTPEGKTITGTTTSPAGTFLLSAPTGTCILTASFSGFKPWQKKWNLQNNLDLGILSLQPDTTRLTEITIQGKQQSITYKPDRTIYNIENSITAIGGNAVNAITATPGITLTNNTLSMLGKGALHVMVDGRIIELSGEALISYLNTIANNEIKSIELISNPPASYDAAGNGGLINILLKKSARNAWKNNTTVAYNQNNSTTPPSATISCTVKINSTSHSTQALASATPTYCNCWTPTTPPARGASPTTANKKRTPSPVASPSTTTCQNKPPSVSSTWATKTIPAAPTPPPSTSSTTSIPSILSSSTPASEPTT